MDFIKKLISRKFITALIGIITGLAVVFGLDEGVISTVAGLVTTVVSIGAYIYTEGKIDTAAVTQAAEYMNQILGTIDVADLVVETDTEITLDTPEV